MDGIFGALIWLVIIFIWVSSALKKIRRKDSSSGEDVSSGLEKKILETLGVSFPEIPEAAIQKPPEPKIEEKIHDDEKKMETKAPREVPRPAVTAVIDEKTERKFPDFSTVEDLQEGVVFSVILGPPKAYRFLGLYSKKPSR